jgi:hypothetical protein
MASLTLLEPFQRSRATFFTSACCRWSVPVGASENIEDDELLLGYVFADVPLLLLAEAPALARRDSISSACCRRHSISNSA